MICFIIYIESINAIYFAWSKKWTMNQNWFKNEPVLLTWNSCSTRLPLQYCPVISKTHEPKWTMVQNLSILNHGFTKCEKMVKKKRGKENPIPARFRELRIIKKGERWVYTYIECWSIIHTYHGNYPCRFLKKKGLPLEESSSDCFNNTLDMYLNAKKNKTKKFPKREWRNNF